MGCGDEILVTGEARALQEADPERRRVLVVDRHNRPRWHVLWEGNPRIAPPGSERNGERLLRLENAAWTRPYIDWHRMNVEFAAVHPGREFTTKKIRDPRLPWRFTNHKAKRGELYLERCEKRGYIVIEPLYKIGVSPNREWGFERYQAVVDALPRLDWVQLNPNGTRILRGARHLPADHFVKACWLLSGAALYVGPEGGLYHAAAALGVPAVAIFGGFVSPANQGYDDPDYVNLYEPMDGASPCGQRVPCPHCKEAMAKITPERVIDGIKRLLNA